MLKYRFSPLVSWIIKGAFYLCVVHFQIFTPSASTCDIFARYRHVSNLYRVTNLARGPARIVINIFLINQWECQPFAGAWQLIQEWFVSCTSTHIITQTPQILRFFIRYNNYQYTYIILCFYVRFTSCCVQNLTHCTLPDKVSGTGIFDSVLNITSNTADPVLFHYI